MNFPQLKYIPLIWLSLIAILVLSAILNYTNADYEIISLITVFVHSVIVLFVLASLPNQFKLIFIWGFIFRILFLLWDFYARDIFILPNSGGDAGMYYGNAVRISEDLTLLFLPNRGGFYSKGIGLLFSVIGPQRLFAQYINVLFGMFVVITVYRILLLLDLAPKVQKSILFITAFFPNSLIMSAIFLREIIPTFFVAISLYYFLLWYKNQVVSTIVISLLLLLVAAVFHSGVIGIFVGYAYFFLFYKKDHNAFKFSSQTIIAFIVVGGMAYFASTQLGDVMFAKFKGADEMEDIYSQANKRLGESAYLTGMTINNPAQFLMYGPIKAFYFLTAPLPMNWRGGMDIFSFVFDSLLYFITIWFIWKNWRYFKMKKPLIIGLIITLIGVAFIFGIGVSNAGTAIRHRQKIIALILILLAVMMDEKEKIKFSSFQYLPQNS